MWIGGIQTKNIAYRIATSFENIIIINQSNYEPLNRIVLQNFFCNSNFDVHVSSATEVSANLYWLFFPTIGAIQCQSRFTICSRTGRIFFGGQNQMNVQRISLTMEDSDWEKWRMKVRKETGRDDMMLDWPLIAKKSLYWKFYAQNEFSPNAFSFHFQVNVTDLKASRRCPTNPKKYCHWSKKIKDDELS